MAWMQFDVVACIKHSKNYFDDVVYWLKLTHSFKINSYLGLYLAIICIACILRINVTLTIIHNFEKQKKHQIYSISNQIE